MNDDKSLDISTDDGFHQRFKLFSTEMNSASDVLDEFMVWIFLSEVLHLLFESLALFGATHSCLTDSSSLFRFTDLTKELILKKGFK